jgi:hypothetical protein
VGTSGRARHGALAVGLIPYLAGWNGALADPPAGTDNGVTSTSSTSDAPKSLPQEGFFSSLKQSIKQSYDQEAVRGHFDLGSRPDVRRFYCLVDIKTGQREPNAVVGDPVPVAGGMTGIKNGAVSFYSCATAEQQGMLVTAGYLLSGPAAAKVAPAPQAQTHEEAPPLPGASPSKVGGSPDQIDIAGVKLGMSPDEVRAVLKSKKLLDYDESAETLSYLDSTKGIFQQVPNGRFVNVIAAWTAPPLSASGDNFEADGESYEIMFTPVPGRERAMGIVHSVGYSLANAIHERTLEAGLINKYGGFAGSSDLPESPTWRFQRGGNVQTGDSCGRRGIFGGLGALNAAKARENIALKRTPDDFGSQIDRCGVAVVTEDHHTANGGALREDRLVTRYTVTAYSPSIGFEGAKTAAQMIQAAGGNVNRSGAPRAKDQPAPSL